MQRFFDIVFSGLAILILSPLLIIFMFILKLTGEGEVFYKQERVGKKVRHYVEKNYSISVLTDKLEKVLIKEIR